MGFEEIYDICDLDYLFLRDFPILNQPVVIQNLERTSNLRLKTPIPYQMRQEYSGVFTPECGHIPDPFVTLAEAMVSSMPLGQHVPTYPPLMRASSVSIPPAVWDWSSSSPLPKLAAWFF